MQTFWTLPRNTWLVFRAHLVQILYSLQSIVQCAMCILLIVQWHTIASISTMGVVRESCFVFAERICNLNFCISPLFVQLPVSVPFIMLLHMNILLLSYYNTYNITFDHGIVSGVSVIASCIESSVEGSTIHTDMIFVKNFTPPVFRPKKLHP